MYAPLFYVNSNSKERNDSGLLRSRNIEIYHCTNIDYVIVSENVTILSVIFVELWGNFVKVLRQSITLSADFKTTMSPGL